MDLAWPALGPFYAAAAPFAEALLRAICGLALVPHGLRAFFGFFPNSGSRILSPALLAQGIERSGFRPGRLWLPVVAFVQFVAGPALALGLFTRPAALLVFVFFLGAAYDHARFDGYFWNKLGLEYPAMWGAIALYFACAGGGAVSLDHLWLGWTF
ncbi:MAG TPA: DoxX family protein [Stellaceae bacterium]|jgi:putative oxidoreductase|nr:DoxX family protein [Stellaceae bacterium]